jgi:Transposase domain (DUF772)
VADFTGIDDGGEPLPDNVTYRWFCGLSIGDMIPDHSEFSRARS